MILNYWDMSLATWMVNL